MMKRHGDHNAIYVDGGYEPHSTAQQRYDRGVADARAIIGKIESGEIALSVGESIKIAGHSHGGWHAVGMADALTVCGYNVEVLYAKNPHNPDQAVDRIDGAYSGRFVQYSCPTDIVSSVNQGDNAPELVKGTGIGQGWGMRKIADGLISDSRMARMPGVTEYVILPRRKDGQLNGHNVYDQIDEIGKYGKTEDGYVGQRVESQN